MAELREVEFYLLIDEPGNFVIDKDRDRLLVTWDENFKYQCIGGRVLALSIKIDTSNLGDTRVSAIVPANTRQAKLTVK